MMLKIVALSMGAAIVASAAQAQTTEQKMVAQIDSTFVCPEALPSDEARNDALKLFMEQVAAAKPSITVAEITQFRVAMLRKHQCNETLANLGVSPVANPATAPGSKNTDVLARFTDWSDCITNAANALEPSAGTPEEIAIASAQRCGDAEVQYFVAEMAGPRPTPTDQLRSHADAVRAVMRDKAIAAVIEARAARANHRAP